MIGKDKAMSLELSHFDTAKYLTEPEDQAELLADAMTSGDVHIIAQAIGIVARAHGMTELAKETGMKRQQLYRMLGPDGNPTLGSVLKLLPALGLRMRIEAVV
jgi:probable addiction module antidote protein